MKKGLLILFFVLFLKSCKQGQSTNKEFVIQYVDSRNAANYDQLRLILNDSITITAGDYVMKYDHNSFYKKQFQWDSVFKSSYKLVELIEKNNEIIATISQNNIRNEFLKNNPLVYQQKISFTSGKISKFEDLESIDTDWTVWEKEKEDLVSWVKINYPELDGFMNDMSINGAVNYLKAIKLYENRK